MHTALLLLLPAASAGYAPPSDWSTLRGLSYSFCTNCSGPFSAEALSIFERSAYFVLSDNTMTLSPPAGTDVEQKMLAAAAQLRGGKNPKQPLLMYVANDYTRTLYASGRWYLEHPECMLRAGGAGDEGAFVYQNMSSWKPSVGQPTPVCVGSPGNPNGTDRDKCYIYGFHTECGRTRWLEMVIDTLDAGGLDGVFIDGFDGCSPEACGRVLAQAGQPVAPAAQAAWLSGFNATMWALRAALDKRGNKTIVCNGTNRPYRCGAQPGDGGARCFCDGSNEERFYGNQKNLDDVQQASSPGANGYMTQVHVPHVDNPATYNNSLAKFLAVAGPNTFYGGGFGYDCAKDGWLEARPEFDEPLGEPLGPPNITVRANMTFYARAFASGTRTWLQQGVSGGPRVPTLSCVHWAGGEQTPYGEGGCDAASAWWTAAAVVA